MANVPIKKQRVLSLVAPHFVICTSHEIYWIRHFEYLNVDFGFIISIPKNPRAPNFIPIK